ncbi:MarR family winged helix-turn-helix transcriptional regulator [Eggerthella timonensis]|uniref:MarR family winged helix-turn-helix transcriptional regulator n=1 Tax=Eggerthella timonensis TaxID=1871008 RepID=UPI0015E08081|nr:MarR family transcriptional regulator [Eggerthella timonensis]
MRTLPYFDSVNFIVLDERYRLLDRVLVANDLSLTKHCVLLKCVELEGVKVPTKDIAEMLGLKPSIVTQAVNDLEGRGLVERLASEADARAKHVVIASAGRELVDKVDGELYASMRELFNPEGNAENRGFLERGLRVGGKIGGIWSTKLIEAFPSSTNLTAISLFRRSVEQELKDATRLSLSECRVLQRLDEAGEPLRIGDLADQMRLSPTIATRAGAGLERAGLVRRLLSPDDRKAVYLEPTEEGERVQDAIAERLDAIGRDRYWGRLDAQDLEATMKIRELFDLARNRRAEEERRRALASLEAR